MNNPYDMPNVENAWCPGCGNFAILKEIKQALVNLKIEQQKVCFVSGIGQAAKLPQYLKVNYFNGLHGRSLPVATAINMANPELSVIVTSGDGCNYGEGGNHFIHTIRKNPNVTLIAHNNQIYGLTKGQTSPTTLKGTKTTSHVRGSHLEPFNPLSVAIALGASFVARAFSGGGEKTVEIIKTAIKHDGFALVDIFQPCVSFNKVNTFKWYKENTYYLDETYDPYNKENALKMALKTDEYPLGILYINKERTPLAKRIEIYETDKAPLFKRQPDINKLLEILDKKK